MRAAGLAAFVAVIAAPAATDVLPALPCGSWDAFEAPPKLIDPRDALLAQYPVPKDLGALPRLSLWATYYSIPRVSAVRSGVSLRDPFERPLGPALEVYDFCRAGMAGTVEVTARNGRRSLYRYEGLAEGDEDAVDCSAYFPGQPAIGRARFQATRRMPVPYRTIAVDPRFIELGSVVFIPAARGTVISLEDGTTRIHDGYFYAVDRGGAIEGPHIDVFLGFAAKNPFIFIRSNPNERFEAYVIPDLELEDALAEAHS